MFLNFSAFNLLRYFEYFYNIVQNCFNISKKFFEDDFPVLTFRRIN